MVAELTVGFSIGFAYLKLSFSRCTMQLYKHKKRRECTNVTKCNTLHEMPRKNGDHFAIHLVRIKEKKWNILYHIIALRREQFYYVN